MYIDADEICARAARENLGAKSDFLHGPKGRNAKDRRVKGKKGER